MSQDATPTPAALAALDAAVRRPGHLLADRPVLNAAKAGYPFACLRGLTGLREFTAAVDFDCVKREGE